MKFLPVLRFEPDPVIEHGRRVEQILRGLGDEAAVGEVRGSEGTT